MTNIATTPSLLDCIKIGNYLMALKTNRNSSGIQLLSSSEYSEYSENGRELKNVDNPMSAQSQITALRLQVHYKPEFQKPGKDGAPISRWFWNGNWLAAWWTNQYNLPVDNEFVAIKKKLQQLKGKLEKVVIYDRRVNAPAPIIFEWHRGQMICDGLNGQLSPKIFE